MAVALDRGYVGDKITEVSQRPGLPFSFTGKAREYFGIWIVNILLSIVTLGIYSPWAKVRDKRYFYGNTKLNGSSFDYLASPIQILKGRLIVLAFFVVYALCASFFPASASLFILVMFFITPWVVIRALAFNARNSSYRNVRFDFVGGLWESVKIYLLMPLGAIVTLGGLIPYNAFRTKQFVVSHSRYGKSHFTFEGTKEAYYKAYGIALLLILPIVLVFITFTYAITYAGAQTAADYASYLPLQPFMVTAAVILAIIGYSYLTTTLQNYMFNITKIGEHRFHLDLSLQRILWIRFSNLVLIGLTIGLMIPWARIRMARYQIERMSLIPHGDLDTLVSEQQGKISAYGDEFGEGMDLDLGLGV